MLIDSHAHLDMKAYDGDRDRVLTRAEQAGVASIITIGVDLTSSLKGLELAHRYDALFSSVGYHPHEASRMNDTDLQQLENLATDSKIMAWGEIGLDFYRCYSPAAVQRAVFEKQLEVARGMDLPVIIHSRDANHEVFGTLKNRKGRLRGAIHCFSGDYDLAMAFIELGFYISIPGIVTYKKATRMQEVASKIPLERLLVETDAPFLTPDPERGKRNEPAFIAYTAHAIARLRGMDFEDLVRRTAENTKKLFNLPITL